MSYVGSPSKTVTLTWTTTSMTPSQQRIPVCEDIKLTPLVYASFIVWMLAAVIDVSRNEEIDCRSGASEEKNIAEFAV